MIVHNDRTTKSTAYLLPRIEPAGFKYKKRIYIYIMIAVVVHVINMLIWFGYGREAPLLGENYVY